MRGGDWGGVEEEMRGREEKRRIGGEEMEEWRSR